MDALLHDLRYAIRTLAKSRGFTLAAVLTLALGIGANTAIFSVVEQLLIHPLPFRDADRLVFLWNTDPVTHVRWSPGAQQLRDWRKARSFETLTPIGAETFFLEGDGAPALLNGGRLAPVLPKLLDLPPVLGRWFVPADTLADAPAVAMLGERFWRRRFGGRENVVGKTIHLDGTPVTVVGVAPERLDAARQWGNTDVWTPVVHVPDSLSQGYANIIGRLRDGVTLAQAQAEMDVIARRLATRAGRTQLGRRARIAVLRPADFVAGELRLGVLILMGAVGLVLLVACANVANLLLARAARREREMAVRAALGAARGRLVRQLLAESLVLSIVGGLGGLLLAAWGLVAIINLRPPYLFQLERASLDPSVLWFTLGLSILTGIIFGLLPSLRASDFHLSDALKGIPAAGGRRGLRTQRSVLAVQLAFTTAVLLAAGLMLRSLVHLQRVDPGFQPEGLAGVEIRLPQTRFPDSTRRTMFWRALLERSQAAPGIARAAIVSGPPPQSGLTFGTDLAVDGQTELTSEVRDAPLVIDDVGSNYFPLFEVPMIAGRPFTPDEHRTEAHVAVIGQTLAGRLWPGRSAVGGRFRINSDDPWLTVVGVAHDVAMGGLIPSTITELQVFQPGPDTWDAHSSWLVARAHPGAKAATLLPAMRDLVRSVDSSAVIATASTFDDLLEATLATPRFNAVLLGTFAGLALLLAAVGLFGILSYAVSRRTREIGIRVALGASADDVVGLVLREGLGPAAIGLVAGLGLALALSRVLASVLYGIRPADPIAMGAVVLVLGVTALLACWLPARRATRVDPVVALRTE